MLTMRHRALRMLLPLLCLAACDRDLPTGPSAQLSFRTAETPSATAATAASASQINVTWADRSTDETGFELHRSTTGATGAFTLRATTAAGVISYSDGGLTASTAYCYKVRAVRGTGKKAAYSTFSNVACATPQAPPPPPSPGPAAPSGVNAKPTTSSQILVTWVDNSADEIGFRIQRSDDAGATWSEASVTWIPNRTAYSARGVTPEQTICFRVLAFNGLGDSPPSNVDCTAAPLGATDLVGVASAGPVVDLTWRDASNVEDGYLVDRQAPGAQWVIVAALPPNATGYRDTGASADMRYTYRVSATRDGGFSDAVGVAVLTAATAPSVPTGFSAVPNASTAVTVTWAYLRTNEEEFRVERSNDGGANWAQIGTVPYSYGSFTDEQVTPDQSVCYRVTAYNAAGSSQPSTQSCTAPPAAPTNLTATAVEGAFAIDLAWNDNSSVEHGYEVWRLVTDCINEYYGCQTYWLVIATLPSNSRSFRHTSVTPSETHFYVVLAVRDGGYSTPSNQAEAAASGPPQ